MAPALRKRAARPTAASRRRTQSTKGKGNAVKPPAKRSSKPRTSKAKASSAKSPFIHPPNNPQATLLGLPTELRLQIYAYLLESDTIIHVHRKSLPGRNRSIFTWTPCKGASATSPLLCANPKWSGLCAEEDRCTYKKYAPPAPRGFAALTASCKFLRSETQGYWMRNTVVSIAPLALRLWLLYLEKHARHQLRNLRRVTLAGPDQYNTFKAQHVRELWRRVPNLEAVAFQGQTHPFPWIRQVSEVYNVDMRSRWHQWSALAPFRVFPRSVTVVVEGLIYLKRRTSKTTKGKPLKEQQLVVRVIREGKEPDENGMFEGEGDGWGDEDVQLELVQPGGLVEKASDALWREWWKDEFFEPFYTIW